jgi:hypothetical protein
MQSSTISAFLVLAALIQAQPQPPQQRLYLDFPTFVAGDLSTLYPPNTALDIINRLCSQVADNEGFVSGALNFETFTFMTWDEYRNGPGADADPEYYYSWVGWETFRGICHFEAGATWVVDVAPTIGPRWENWAWLPWQRELTVDIRMPAFKCTTTLISSQNNVRSFILMSTMFHDLLGLPVAVSQTWDWVRYADEVEPYTYPYDIPPCRAAFLSASKTLRTVRAYQVFQIDGYYWNFGPGAGDRVGTWRGAGEIWERVYSSGGYIDGTALAMQAPDEYIVFFRHTYVLHGLPCD